MPKLIIAVGVLICIYYIISLFIIQGREINAWNELNRQTELNYLNQFKVNLEKKPNELINELTQGMGTFFFKPKQNLTKNNNLSVDEDPVLTKIFETPELMQRLNLGYPYVDPEIANKIGTWHCRDDNKVYTIDIKRDRNKPITLEDRYGPIINCETLKSGLILRTGNKLGDWVILLDDKEDCQVLFDGTHDFYCASSVTSWFASEILISKHRWQALSINDQSISIEMRKVQNLEFQEIIIKLDAFDGSTSMYEKHDLDDSGNLLASKSYYQTINSIENKPAVFLNENETFPYRKNRYKSKVRLWEGDQFHNVILSPTDYQNAVVVVMKQYSGEWLVEIVKDDKLLYVDLSERKAFLTFTDWARFLLAKGMLFEQDYDFKHAPNLAQ